MAAMSDVEVKIMLSAKSSGNPLPEWAGNTYIAEIVASSARFCLYQKGYLNAKAISIDHTLLHWLRECLHPQLQY